MTKTVVLQGISSLSTLDPRVGSGVLGEVTDAAVVLDGERIAWVGPAARAPACDEAIDLGGRCVLPGWVDSHSHLVFAGDRSAEFAARMAGVPYSAGGIATTVAATRRADGDALERQVRRHLAEMLLGGTTWVETKSGYGLSVADEVTSVSAARRAGANAITFLGAHAVPAEYSGDPAGYVDLVCGPMLAAVADQVDFVDVFCEQGAFDADQSARVLQAGQQAGLGLKVHGNQLGPGPGVQLAVGWGAVSVDHCTYLTSADIEALAGSSTVATLLPLTDLSTRQPPPPARQLLDAGARIALASNCNPGSGYTSSMNLAVGLGVLQCRMTVAEAVTAATVGGAAALGRNDVGRLVVGGPADLQVLDAPSVDYLAYRVGVPLTWAVWRRGRLVVGPPLAR